MEDSLLHHIDFFNCVCEELMLFVRSIHAKAMDEARKSAFIFPIGCLKSQLYGPFGECPPFFSAH